MTLLNIFLYISVGLAYFVVCLVSCFLPLSLPLFPSARSLFYLTRHYVFTTLFLTVLTKRKRQTKRRVQTTRQRGSGGQQEDLAMCPCGCGPQEGTEEWRGEAGKHFSWRHFIKMGNESIPAASNERGREIERECV